ncbi:MAG: response regulator [Thermodesulfobacteriota bacterium]|nr:response regulator [Thermodesulfobacteriota bacterium]
MYDFSRLKIERAGTVGRILIVDDDTDSLELIADMVSSLGYSIETASDGREAAVLLKGEDFSTLITDISMPRMDGMELP